MLKFKITVLCLLLVPVLILHTQEKNDKVGIDEQLGEYIPEDVEFTDSNGEVINLKKSLDGKPAVISMVYFKCPGICSPLLEGFAEVMEATDIEPGEDYTALSISFDPSEDSEVAAKWKKNYLAGMKREIDPKGWKFLTGEKEDIITLTKSLGFNYSKEENNKDFLHGAALIVVSPEGKITRYHNGTEFLPFNLKMSVIEAGNEQEQPTMNKILQMCFKYDPEGRSYVLNLLPIVGGTMTIVLFSFMGYLIYQSRKRKLELEMAKNG